MRGKWLSNSSIFPPRPQPSSVELKPRNDMTETIAKPLNTGLPPHTERNLPFVMAFKKTSRPLPTVSGHVPVTPENRSRLRVLRQAEMAAWTATTAVGFDTGHFERTQTDEKERRDLRTFGWIATLAVATVTISLLKSSAVAESWAGFVSLVRQLIG